MTLSVHLGDVDPVADYVWGADPPTLSLVPKFWSKERTGGYKAAEVQVLGAESHLWDVLTWLRRPVEIIGEFGQGVWAGFVNEVQVTTGSGVEFSISMDGMANRIAVAYAARAADGGTERGTTGWSEDEASIRRYGTKEYLHILGEGEASDAALALSKLIDNMRKPRANRTLQGGKGTAEARLLCLGWAETLRWRRWERTGTRIEFEGLEAADDQAIGWGLAGATTIAITKGGGSGIHDISGRMGALRIGNKITVSGSASNSGTYTVYDYADDEAEVYTATTIYFEGDNDVKDTAGGLGKVRKGAVFTVTGSSTNSGTHRCSAAGDDALEVDTVFYGEVIAGETAGPSITIQQGNEALVYPRPAANEAVGASITLTLQGYRMAQSFTLSSAANVGQIAVLAGVTGSPLDMLQVAVYSDSSGSPGISLGSATVDPDDLPGDPNWVWFRFDGAGVVLSAGTYWIVVERTASASGSHFYRLGMTTTGAGTCKAYTGSSWVSNPTGACMPHKVWLVEQTTAIMEDIANTVGEFLAAVRVDDASGVYVNPEENGDRTAYDVIDRLIDLGTAAGARLYWEVTGERALRVYEEPGYDFNPIILSADGALRNQGGSLLARGELPTARYLIIEDVPEHLGLWPIVIDGAEYDAEAGAVQLYPKEEGTVTI